MRNFLNFIAGPLQWLYRACGYLAALSLVALGLLVMTSIVSRLIGLGLIGLTSYATYAMAASWFLAFAYTFGAGEHIRVSLLIARLKGRTRLIVEGWCLLAALAISGMLTFYAYQLVYLSWMFNDRSPAADATLLWIPQLSFVIGAAVLTLAILEKLLRLVFLGEFDLKGDVEPELREAQSAAASMNEAPPLADVKDRG